MTMIESYALKAAMILRSMEIDLPIDLLTTLAEQGYDLSALDQDTCDYCFGEADRLDELWDDLEDEQTQIAELEAAFRMRAAELD